MNTRKETSKNLLCRVLWLYYVQQMNQREIGDYLGLSRIKVVRLLKEGRELGLIDIQIKSDHLFLFSMEMELCQLTGLKKAWVIPSGGDPIETVGAGAVYRFQQALLKHQKISIGSGRTYYAMSRHLPSIRSCATKEIVSIGAFDSEDFLYNPQTLGHTLTSKVDVKFFHVKIPTFTDDPAISEAVRKSKVLSEAMERATNVDICFTSVGAVESSHYLYYNRVSDKERKRILATSAIAEMDGNFFDTKGNIIKSLSVENVHIPLPMKCPIVLVAGGESKVKAIAAVIRSGYINELVVDENAAKILIDIFTKSPHTIRNIKNK